MNSSLKNAAFFKNIWLSAGFFVLFTVILTGSAFAAQAWISTPGNLRANAAGDITYPDGWKFDIGSNLIIRPDTSTVNFTTGFWTDPFDLYATRTRTTFDGINIVRSYPTYPGPGPHTARYYITLPNGITHYTGTNVTTAPSGWTVNYRTGEVFDPGGNLKPPTSDPETSLATIIGANPGIDEKIYYLTPLQAKSVFDSFDHYDDSTDDTGTGYDDWPDSRTDYWRPVIEAGQPMILVYDSATMNTIVNEFFDLKPFIFANSNYFCNAVGGEPAFCPGSPPPSASIPPGVTGSGTESVDSSGLVDTSIDTADVLGLVYAQVFEGGDQSVNHWKNQWNTEMEPDFKNLTAQWHTGIIDQSRTQGSLTDAQQQVDYQRETQEREMEDRVDMEPSELTCAVSSHTPSLSAAGHLSRQITRGMGDKVLKTGLNTAGTPAAKGPVTDNAYRFDIFRKHFCDSNTNKGAIPCIAGPSKIIDADVSIENFLLRDTINMDDDTVRLGIDALTRNLIQSDVAQPLPESALGSPASREILLNRRDLQNLKDITASVIGGIVGRRTSVPGTTLATGTIREIREKAGVDPAQISDRPSYNEIMLALTKERFFDPEYFIRLNQKEGAIKQEQAAVDILTGVVLQNIYQLQEQMNALLAARSSMKFNSYTFDTMIEEAPSSN